MRRKIQCLSNLNRNSIELNGIIGTANVPATRKVAVWVICFCLRQEIGSQVIFLNTRHLISRFSLQHPHQTTLLARLQGSPQAALDCVGRHIRQLNQTGFVRRIVFDVNALRLVLPRQPKDVCVKSPAFHQLVNVLVAPQAMDGSVGKTTFQNIQRRGRWQDARQHQAVWQIKRTFIEYKSRYLPAFYNKPQRSLQQTCAAMVAMQLRSFWQSELLTDLRYCRVDSFHILHSHSAADIKWLALMQLGFWRSAPIHSNKSHYRFPELHGQARSIKVEKAFAPYIFQLACPAGLHAIIPKNKYFPI